MEYEKGNTYLITCTIPLVIRTKASDDGTYITTYPPGHKIECISYTTDDCGDIWIRIELGWVKATSGEEIFIQ